MKRFINEHRLVLIRLFASLTLLAIAILIADFSKYMSLGLYIASYLILIYDIAFYAFKDLIKEKAPTEKMLMLIASLGAMLIGEMAEGVLIIALYLIGEIVESGAKSKSKSSIEALCSLRSDRVRLEGGDIIPASDAKIGDLICVYPGERISLDGDVVNSEGTVNTSVITGESFPKEVFSGSEVLAGYINMSTVLTVRVKRTLDGSAAQRIIDLSEKALIKKTKSERFITKFSKIYTVAVICLALAISVIPPLFDNFNFIGWIYKALAMVAISCPCAFVISVPLAYFCGIGYASKKGILIKNSAIMETLRGIEVTAFDKTGTLTRSELHVTRIDTGENMDKIKLLEIVAMVESKSNHPMATAIVAEAKKFNIAFEEGENYKETVGSGVECDSKYGHIKAGNRFFVDPPSGAIASVYVSLNGKYIGSVGIGDELKSNSKIAFEKLRKLGVKKKIILSGDKKSKVDAVAKTLLAETAYSNLKPEDKLNALEDIMINNPGMSVAYCGDGINDMPTLARADVGIAMGDIGSDGVVAVSDVIIMDDNIEKVPLAIKISQRTNRVVVSNIVFSILIKAVVLVLLGLPFVKFKMIYAVLADVGALILAILNSLRAGR